MISVRYHFACEKLITVEVVLLGGIKFGDLAPNRTFINIGEIIICRSAQPNLRRSPGVKILAEVNLAVQTSIAKLPNLIHHQLLFPFIR